MKQRGSQEVDKKFLKISQKVNKKLKDICKKFANYL